MYNFSDISIVLVETQSQGNLGAVARIMKNMGLSQLVLVDCQTEIGDESFRRSCGAEKLLENANQVTGLSNALAPFHLSIGTTSRSVRWFSAVHSPSDLTKNLVSLSSNQKVAIVFGPERTGLTNEHLKYCQWQLKIPTDSQFVSLNLAHAVAIVAYELYLGSNASKSAPKNPLKLAVKSQVEGFTQDLEKCLDEIEFLSKQNPEEVMMTLRQIFSRASLEERDVRILRGILRQWRWYAELNKKT